MEDETRHLWDSRVEDYLVWLPFPATRDQILDRLRWFGLPPSDIYAAMLELPAGTYNSPREVAQQIERKAHYREQLDRQGSIPSP